MRVGTAASGGDASFVERTWRRIVTTQPGPVRVHLAAEREAVAAVLAASSYDTVVEVGCADGSLLLPTVVRHGLDYRGIDLAAGAVAATRRVLEQVPGATPARDVVQADAHDLAELVRDGTLPVGRACLVAFPFNVLGTLARPRDVLAAVAAVGADLLVLSYDTGEEAGRTRAQYYTECGFRGRLHRDELGVHFVTGGFRSSVYHPPVLCGWVAAQGYEVERTAYGRVGVRYHGRRARPVPRPG